MDNDPCKFVLSCRGSSERFTLQAANTDIKQVWVQHINELLDAQSNFLSGEESPALLVEPPDITCPFTWNDRVLRRHPWKTTFGALFMDYSALFASFAFISVFFHLAFIHKLFDLLFTALQSPIEYQKEKGSSHSLSRNSGSSRPSSTVSISPEKPALSGRVSTPVKLPTSNGSACFEPHKHSDKYEGSKVNKDSLFLLTCRIMRKI